MKTRIAWASLLWLLPAFLMGQDFILTGRIMNYQTKKGVPNITVKVVGYNQTTTDDEGVFRIAIPAKLTRVKLEVAGGYKPLLEGEMPVPKSSDEILQVLVEKLVSENDRLQREVDRLSRQNRLKVQQIQALKSTIEDSISVYRQRLAAKSQDATIERDSLVQLVERLTAKLESNYILANKRETYQNVSTNLLTYLTKLKDLRDWLKHVDDVLVNQKAADNFNKTLEAYSAARDELFVQQADYLDQVQKYWTDESLTTDLKRICDLALKDIHDQHILPLNDTILKSVGEFYTGKKARLTAKKEVKKQAETTLANLLLPIRELEQEINTFNAILSKIQ